jgi:hypothetical protein
VLIMAAPHVMLDLETMSTAPNAAIVQIGAVRFDPMESTTWIRQGRFERTVALQSSLLAGGVIDPETVAWWRRQEETARFAITADAFPLDIALSAFTRWFPKGATIWSHGAAFDVPVLDHAYRSLGLVAPWGYRDIRDTRTLYSLAEQLAGWKRPEHLTTHCALADALDQAGDVQSAYQALWSLKRQMVEAVGRLDGQP